MSTSTKTTSTKTTSTKTTTAKMGRPKTPQYGLATVAVSFSVWGPLRSRVTASGGGGRGDAPYIAVTVGDTVTYVYDRDALRSHLRAWREAVEINNGLRLPAMPPAHAAAEVAAQAGQDMALIANVSGLQRTHVTGQIDNSGAAVLTVIIGAISVRVFSSEALRSYLRAWTQAEPLAGILADPDTP